MRSISKVLLTLGLALSVSGALAANSDKDFAVTLVPVKPDATNRLFISCPTGKTTILVFPGNDIIQSFQPSTTKGWDIFKPRAGNSLVLTQKGNTDAVVMAKSQHNTFQVNIKALKTKDSGKMCYFEIKENSSSKI